MDMECDNISFSTIIKIQTKKLNPHNVVNILTLGLILLILSTNAAASDWFVRPTGGNYGSENGSSYHNAWDGLNTVIWGPGGVVAGDTLYVCGLFLIGETTAGPTDMTIGASGGGESTRIMIRGDASSIDAGYEDGIIWGSSIATGEYNVWSDEGNNVYSTELQYSISYGYFIFEDVTATSMTLLTQASTLQECQDTPGSYYAEFSGSNYPAHGDIYVHCTDNGNPDGRITMGNYGNRILINHQQYITFKNIDFYYPLFRGTGTSDFYLGSYIRWEGCKLWYNPDGLSASDYNHHFEWIDCDRAYGVGGIGFSDAVPRGEDAPHHMTIRDCKIHDIGVYVKNADSESIGTNGVDYLTIENNEFYNCGSAFTSYPYTGSTNIETIIRWNYIHDLRKADGEGRGRGIELNMDPPNYTSDKSGCQVYGNIVVNAPDVAYRSTFATDQVVFYNNLAYKCDTSFYFNYVYTTDTGPNIVFRNNISINPTTMHIYFGSVTDEGNYTIDSDYNLFYPDMPEGFRFKDVGYHKYTNLSGWQMLSMYGCTFDPNSIVADPLFVDPENGDFSLLNDSLAIDTGFDVGLTQDFQGKLVPQGSAPDIGAYEYTLNPITDLAVSGTSQNSVSLSWTMPSDDGLANMPSRYDIRYATSLITEANWGTATQVQGEPAPEDFGLGRTFTISGLTPGTTYYIAIKTSNETGSTSSPLSNVISQTTATTGNFAPVMTSIGDKAVENNELLTFTISATDADIGDTLSYSATDLPPDATFTDQTFTWTPTDSQGGTYHVTFQVTDGSVAVTQTIRIVVNEAPVLAAIGNKTISEGALLSFSISATDPDGDAITYSATDIPAGAAFAGRTFTWTPSYTQAGTYDVTFAATDGIAQDSETITITVNNTNRAPVLDTIGDKYVNEDMLLTFVVSATEPDGEDIAYSAAGLPAGATFTDQTFSWTPSSSNVGNNYPVTFTATDGQLSDSETVNITVVSDTTAPSVSNLSPAADSIQAPLNSLIILHVTDSGVGVDADTVTITLDGDTIYTGDSSDYSSATGNCRRSGTKADYTYAYQSSQNFGFDQSKTVTVNAADLVGNVMTERSYSFITEMRSFGQNIRVDTTVQGINKAAPSTVQASNGNIWAVWHAGPSGSRNIYVAKLRADRSTFSASVRLTSSSADQANPAIALGTDDKLYVAWQDKRHGDWDIYASTSVDGANWTTQTRVNDPNEGNQINPAIVVGSQSPNYAYVAWQDDHAGNQDIYITSSNDSFGTKTVAQITSSTAKQTNPAIAIDSANTVYVLWTDARNATNDIYGAAGGTWTNVPIVTKAGSQSNPVIATESAGAILHMLWVDQISGNSDIYYASSDGLPSSPLAGTNLIDDTLGKEQISPAIAVTGSTGDDLEVFACWRDERNVSDSSGDTDIYMVQSNSGVGTNVFVGDGDTNSDQIEPAISTDQYGYPYLVWTDYRTANKEIYFAGSVYLQSVPLESELITASAGGTVGTAPSSIADDEDVSVVVPAGACPYDVTISITKIENPHEYGTLPLLNGYDFGPSGITFNTPVTVTVPYTVTGDDGTPTVYWYDSRAWYDPLSQQGITDIETIVITSSLHALRFKTTHFTPFYVVMGPEADTVTDTVALVMTVAVVVAAVAAHCLIPRMEVFSNISCLMGHWRCLCSFLN